MPEPVRTSGKTRRKRSAVSPRTHIIIRGARVNMLKNISLELPRYRLIVITGVSGSGKSSLAFDTIYAEGQRRYVESLSAYARQFLERMDKPDVDYIQGISPAIAIEQKTIARNPRSTVGTTTEIYDYLRLLYGRIGKTYCLNDGNLVQRDSVRTALDRLRTLPDRTRLYVTFPLLEHEGQSLRAELENIREQGFARVLVNGELYELDDPEGIQCNKEDVRVVVDRLMWKPEMDTARLADSLQTAFHEGGGNVFVYLVEKGEGWKFSAAFECTACHTVYPEPDPKLFSFNNPIGACPTCQGFGRTIGLDMDLIVPNPSKSLREGAVQPWNSPAHKKHLLNLIRVAPEHDVNLDIPYAQLSQREKDFVYNGCRGFLGIKGFFAMVEKKSYKMHYRILHARYRGYTRCHDCGGSRLRPETLAIKINGKNIYDIVCMPISTTRRFFDELALTDYEQAIADRILKEIRSRLQFLDEVGLGYLTLDRLAHTLSGGETQRINLATSLGSSLVGALYVLDEPSIGLHPRDNKRLISLLQKLRNSGNTVIVVEHDPDMIKAADIVVDLGPRAGVHGGEVLAVTEPDRLGSVKKSLTGQYLSGRKTIPVPPRRRKGRGGTLVVKAPTQHNLKGMDVAIPLRRFVCITGVSGSGKSTLVHDILYSGLKKQLTGMHDGEVGAFEGFTGTKTLAGVEMIDQSPIGRSPRSNPVTYIKAFDAIRDVFASTPASRIHGFSPGFFSFNVPGGRCETCEGEGYIKVEMQFLADLYLQCEDCKGTRYKKEIREVRYQGKNIVDILDMTVEEALEFFSGVPRIAAKLRVLSDVGLGYIKLGQPATTLSGGEAQRLKLALHMSNNRREHILFLFDEPTTGLHFEDIAVLLKCFGALIENGHSIIIIEHNLEIIKCADHIIDLGPEGGEHGGEIVAEGTPEEVAKSAQSYTGKYLKEVLARGLA